jgi:hypothetical protein
MWQLYNYQLELIWCQHVSEAYVPDLAMWNPAGILGVTWVYPTAIPCQLWLETVMPGMMRYTDE